MQFGKKKKMFLTWKTFINAFSNMPEKKNGELFSHRNLFFLKHKKKYENNAFHPLEKEKKYLAIH